MKKLICLKILILLFFNVNIFAAEKIEFSEDERMDSEFYISEISDDLFEKMKGKSYKADCTIDLNQLRYIHVLHWNLLGMECEGEIVCNVQIAEKLILIFKELYKIGYEIEKIRLVDEYDADDEKSMADNNSSCFNFRFISHTTTVSKHGSGMAIDINPLYNPYIKYVNGKLNIEPANAKDYIDRTKDFACKIDHQDAAYKIFTKYGFEWGGDWEEAKDYQHFEM